MAPEVENWEWMDAIRLYRNFLSESFHLDVSMEWAGHSGVFFRQSERLVGVVHSSLCVIHSSNRTDSVEVTTHDAGRGTTLRSVPWQAT